jgi:hypothetical protein
MTQKIYMVKPFSVPWTVQLGFAVFLCAMILQSNVTSIAQIKESQSDGHHYPIIISRDTTWFTEPLNEYGNVDFLEAINRHSSKGVTPENNLAVALVKAFGTQENDQRVQEQMLVKLGLDPSQEIGERPIDFEEFYEKQVAPLKVSYREIEETSRHIITQPWTKEDYPEAAAWVLEYSPILDAYLADLANKTVYFAPCVQDPDRPGAFWGQQFRPDLGVIAELLSARSMLRLGLGDIDGCQNDLIAIRKTAKLITIDGDLTQLHTAAVRLIGASFAEVAMYAHPDVSVLHLEDYAYRINDLHFEPDMQTAYNIGERIGALKWALAVRANQDEAIADLGMYSSDPWYEWVFLSIRKRVDWNVTLRQINRDYDEYVELFAESPPDHILRRLEQDREAFFLAQDRVPTFLENTNLMGAVEPKKSEMATERFLRTLPLKPNYHHLYLWQLRCEANDKMLDITSALFRYNKDHGHFPGSLDLLFPSYLKSIPTDPFNGEPFVYTAYSDHFLLYSVGSNLVDDGGNIVEDDADKGITSDPFIWKRVIEQWY